MKAAISPPLSFASLRSCPISSVPNMASPPPSSRYSAAAPAFPVVVKRTSIASRTRWETRRTAENIGLEAVPALRHLEEAVAAKQEVAVDDAGAPAAPHTTASEGRRAILNVHQATFRRWINISYVRWRLSATTE